MEAVNKEGVQCAVCGVLGHQDLDQVVASAGQIQIVMAYHLSVNLAIRKSNVNKPYSNMTQYHCGLFSSTKTSSHS